MKRWTSSLVACAVLVFAAGPLAPVHAQAACRWGCACLGNACGCNSNGNCDATASGCVVSGCNVTRMFFAPDSSVVRLASSEDADGAASQLEGVAGAGAEISGTTRWEAGPNGGSVARHCSGVILARYYPPEEAALIREASQTLTL